MAQQGPLTSAAQNFFSAFNAAQTRQRQEELIQLKRQEKQDIINAAELKRQQDLDDREDLALSIEGAIGIDTGGAREPGEPGEQRGRGRVDGFVFATDRSRKAFSEAVANNPSVSAPILNFLSKSSDSQLKQRARQTDRRFRGWKFLQEQKQKGELQFQEGIKQLVESGLHSEKEREKLVQLSNEPNSDLANLTIEKGISDTEPEKILIDDELAKRKEGRAEQIEIKKEERTPLTGIAKARKDLKADLITKEDFKKLSNVPIKFQSPIGKLMGDKRAAINLFGKGSQQVKAFDEAIKAESRGEVKLSDEKGIRGDFMKLSGDFIKLGDNFRKVQAARSTPAGDVSLIFNFMKMLDPTSVVREGEQATAASAGEVPDRIRNLYNLTVGGQKLSPLQREDFKKESQNIFASQLPGQLRREREFTGISERAGINPKNVVLDLVGDFRKKGATPGTNTIGRFKVEVE